MQSNQEKSAQNVLEFYFLTVKLKELVRSGWKQWNVERERLESVAEHIFSTSMLAIAIDSEYKYDIDLRKVVLMLAIHELEEIAIDDITPFDGVATNVKLEKGHEAVKRILQPLVKGAEYEALIHEFDAHGTNEAKFAYMCDKLDANLMSLLYDCDGQCGFDKTCSKVKDNPLLKELMEKYQSTMGECFYRYEQLQNRLDENFLDILDVARMNFLKRREE